MDKKQLLQTMGWKHLGASFDIKTLNGNIKAVLKDEIAVADGLIGCLQNAPREAMVNQKERPGTDRNVRREDGWWRSRSH